MSHDEVKQVISNYFAATRAMDLETWLQTFAEDAVSYEPESPVLKGHTALTQFFQNIKSAFETVGLTEDSLFITGNQVAVKWTGNGISKNGRQVKFEGIDVFEVNATGKIQRMWAYWNPGLMMAQL